MKKNRKITWNPKCADILNPQMSINIVSITYMSFGTKANVTRPIAAGKFPGTNEMKITP